MMELLIHVIYLIHLNHVIYSRKLSFRCIHLYVRQLYISAVCRILLSNHFSPQEAPYLPFLWNCQTKNREKQFFKTERYTKNLLFRLFHFSVCMPYLLLGHLVIFTSSHVYFPHAVEYWAPSQIHLLFGNKSSGGPEVFDPEKNFWYPKGVY